MTDKQEITLPEPDGQNDDGHDFYSFPTVRRLIAEAVAAEREACAQKACEFLTKARNPFGNAVADAIRSRGDQT